MIALALLIAGATISPWPHMDACRGSRFFVFDDKGVRIPVCDEPAGERPDFLFRHDFE